MKTAAHRHRIGGIGLFKILIAEDDRELRQLFAHVLTKNGYTVLGVSNGEEALDALEQSYYDLIISDIMMPKMDGYELVRSIRESGSSIPIMMITAKDAFDDMRLGFLSGSDDYMVKPINIGEMVLRVSALLRPMGYGQIALILCVFVAIYGGSMWLFGLDKYERELFSSPVQKILRRLKR